MDLKKKKDKVERTYERAWREKREGENCHYILRKIKTHVREREEVTIVPAQRGASQALPLTFRQFHFHLTHTFRDSYCFY